MPANAGIQEIGTHRLVWIPAFAGMTVEFGLTSEHLNPLHKINSLSILSGYYDEIGIRTFY
jgi:hypothetical protein